MTRWSSTTKTLLYPPTSSSTASTSDFLFCGGGGGGGGSFRGIQTAAAPPKEGLEGRSTCVPMDPISSFSPHGAFAFRAACFDSSWGSFSRHVPPKASCIITEAPLLEGVGPCYAVLGFFLAGDKCVSMRHRVPVKLDIAIRRGTVDQRVMSFVRSGMIDGCLVSFAVLVGGAGESEEGEGATLPPFRFRVVGLSVQITILQELFGVCSFI